MFMISKSGYYDWLGKKSYKDGPKTKSSNPLYVIFLRIALGATLL